MSHLTFYVLTIVGRPSIIRMLYLREMVGIKKLRDLQIFLENLGMNRSVLKISPLGNRRNGETVL